MIRAPNFKVTRSHALKWAGRGAVIALAVANLGDAPKPTTAVAVSPVYSFTNGADGGGPASGLLIDNNGAMYGTAFSGGAMGFGVVYKIVPTSAHKTAWTEQVLWNFTGGTDGCVPYGALVSDDAGALYGTTSACGAGDGSGTVFKLTPPPSGVGAWTESTIWTFSRAIDGSSPSAGLIIDGAGNLYGTTELYGAHGFGAAFELSPPASSQSSWAENVLWSFTNGADGGRPKANLLLDSKGNLYGTASRGGAKNVIGGTVFMLSPPQNGGGWTETTLYSFSGPDGLHPNSSLIADASGALYGTAPFGGTSGQGVAFKLVPPAVAGGAWSETTIWNFSATAAGAYPYSGFLADKNGVLYGTTYGYSPVYFYNIPSTIYSLQPPVAGSNSWTGTVLASTQNSIGTDLLQPLSADPQGRLFTTATQVGGLHESTLEIDGSVMKISGAGFAVH